MDLALYITEPHCVVRCNEGLLVVTRDPARSGDPALREAPRETILRVNADRLETLALIGTSHITREAVALCLESGIAVAWLSAAGRLLGRLVPARDRNGDLRMQQYRSAADPVRSLDWARRLVMAKLHSAAAVFDGLARNRPSGRIAASIPDLRRLAGESFRTPSVEALRGHEGYGARLYFQALSEGGFQSAWAFPGRRRHPATDPVNSFLSLAYTLLGQQIASTLEARGLDPTLGLYHFPTPSRPSLALDLVEELRHPVADRFALRVLNRGQFRVSDFEYDPSGACRLLRPALKRFFELWHEALDRPMHEEDAEDLVTAKALIPRQVERLVAWFRHDEPYQPFRLASGRSARREQNAA